MLLPEKWGVHIMISKNIFEVIDERIFISREEWEKPAIATFREDYYDELSSVTWILQNGYLYNRKLGGTLHRYMMTKWYGEDMLKDFTDRGYVVDHLNNNHMDCRITNLEFLKKAYNTAKGQSFDADSKEMQNRIAVTLFKDFSTGYYQITIGCNDYIEQKTADGNIKSINAIKYLYESDYSIVINDAENIIRIYETEGRIPTSNLNACEIKIYYSPNIELTDEEKNRAFIERDGQYYIVLGNGHTSIQSVNYDKGWKPHQK